MALEGGEKGDEEEEDGMDVDKSSGENAADADEEMDEDGSEDEGDARDETFTTPKIRTVAVGSDAEMGDASGSEHENSFNLQTPNPLRRNGKRTRSNLTLRRPGSVTTLNPRNNAQDARLKVKKVYPASPSRPLPLHLAPQISAIPSGSSVRSVSTTLSTLGGGDSLMTGDGSEREEIKTPLSPGFPSPVTYAAGTSSEVHPPFPIPDVHPSLVVPGNVRGKRLFPRTHSTGTRSRPPNQTLAVTSSSSGGASSRASSRSRGSRKSQGLQPVARKKNAGGPGLPRIGVRPIAKGAENVPISMPIPILVSDSEDAWKSAKQFKGMSGADGGEEARSDAPSSKKLKISSTLRKASSLESKAMPPPRQRPAAPQKPIRISRSTSSGVSASSSNVGARKKVGFAGSDKPAVLDTLVRSGGAGSANESGG